MGKDAAVANSETATSTLREQHVRRVVDAAQESHSAITRRNYLAAWRRFEAWADREGLGSIPALPETVAAYLAERAANGLSPASLRLDRPAIRYHHTEAGHANPADNEGVRRVLRGLTRRAAREGRTPRQAAAQGLAAIRETAQLRRTGPGGRTERASKARWRGQVDTWGDVAFRSDGSRPRHRPPLQERPGRQRGHSVRWESRRDGSSGDPLSRLLAERPGLRPPFRSGSVESDRRSSQGCGFDGPFSRDTHPGSGWPLTWWPRARESLPFKSPDAGLPPQCPPTTPAPN